MAPQAINSYPVVSSRRCADGSYIVLVHRPNHTVHKYVVARWWPGLRDWRDGDYIQGITPAIDAMKKRAR